MSITSEITRINNNIADAYSSVGNKGGTLPQVQNSANLSTAIDSIPAGGGGGSTSSNDVNFYDYDGTLLHSYSANEFAELTAMPANPTHQGLTAQGWNWSLADAKEYVAEYGMLDVGQMYVTDDGKTRIYITLKEGRLEPYLGFAINGTATVDWGDGNTEQVTGTSISSNKYIQHSYTKAGDYVITIESPNTMKILGDSYDSKLISKTSNKSDENNIYHNSIKKIELGNSIVSIGNFAFQSCRSLANITIPLGLNNIGYNAFASCNSLKNIAIPSSVRSIESFTFGSCHSLKNIAIPLSIKRIDSSAFSGCYSLNNITIPSGVTSVGNSIFYNCTALKSIIILSNIKSIGDNDFQNCYSLNRIAIPSDVTSIGTYAFQNCSSLENIAIPSGVTSIGSSAFSNCSSLNNIAIPSGVTSIGSSAFSGCSSLNNIAIPSGVTSIGSSMFYNCAGISYFDFTSHTSVPTLSNKNAFASIATDCKIIVPDELYEDWIVATNWSTYASYIVKESEA